MSLQQQYQPFSGAPSSSGQAYPYPQHQQQQHPQPPQPQPIQHRQPPPAQQQPSQMDPSTYASAAYYQPPPQVAQASRKSSGVGGAGDDGEGGQMESGSSAAGSKESDGNSFEFTKRKKWAQLLIDELHDSVIVVCLPLSNGGQRILYVSPGAKELIGYSSRELENKNLAEMVHEPDMAALTAYINQSIITRTDMASFHRFKSRRPPAPTRADSSASDVSDSSTDVVSSRGTRGSVDGSNGVRPVLMEVRGHGFWGEEEERLPVPVSLSLAQPPQPPSTVPSNITRPALNESSSSFLGASGNRCKAFFLVLRHWPSRSMEMANTFLAEKIENERLKAELMSLEGGDPSAFAAPPSMEGPDSAYGSTPYGYPPPPPQLHHAHSYGSAYDDTNVGGGAYDDDDSDREQQQGGGVSTYAPPPHARPHPVGQGPKPPQQQHQQQATLVGKDHPSELGKKSKKSKKAKEEGNYVCVTCGRTDSPEWRKGPLGPKTLCNACGLRYAKKQQLQAAADGTGPPVPPKKKAPPKDKPATAAPTGVGGGGDGQGA